MKLTRGREMHIKMKKETWWGKEENRHAGSIKPADDTRDGTGGLLTRQRLSTRPAFFASRATVSYHLTAKAKHPFCNKAHLESLLQLSVHCRCNKAYSALWVIGYRRRGIEPITPIFPGRV